jgi:hypothetical protein
MSDNLNIDPERTYIMTIVYHSGTSDTRRIKGKKLAAALKRHNGKKTVRIATARPA